MNKKSRTQKQEELDTLEEFVKRNYIGGYGRYVMFSRFVHQYPCEYKDFVEAHHGDKMERMNTNIRSAYHNAIHQINLLYTQLLLHICDPEFYEMPDALVLEKLEVLLKKQNQEN